MRCRFSAIAGVLFTTAPLFVHAQSVVSAPTKVDMEMVAHDRNDGRLKTSSMTIGQAHAVESESGIQLRVRFAGQEIWMDLSPGASVVAVPPSENNPALEL